MAGTGHHIGGHILGGALFAAAQHAALFERVMAAWDRHSGLVLKRWLLAAWVQAANETRLEREGGPLLFRFLEEEVEQLSRSAELLRSEVEQERLRNQRVVEAGKGFPQTVERQDSFVDASALGGGSLVKGTNAKSEGNPATSCGNGCDDLSSQLCQDNIAMSDTCEYLRNNQGTATERLVRAVAFLFWHTVRRSCNSPLVAHSSCCDQAGRVSRRAFAGLVVRVLGVSSGLAAGLLAEVVGAVWPMLDPTGTGVVSKETFLHLAESGVLPQPTRPGPFTP